jgi:hypothetical protein
MGLNLEIMKKVISFFSLVLFITSLNAAVIMKKDCTALAISVADAYDTAGYDHYDSWQAGNWAYEGCVSDGGNPGDTVVVIE